MQVEFQPSEKFTVKVEGDTHKALWQEMSALGELFSPANTECGCCKSKQVRPVVRTVETGEGKKREEFTYYEMHCMNTTCRARLAFGCNKTGDSLFPKKKGEDGQWLPNNGWSKYDPNAQTK